MSFTMELAFPIYILIPVKSPPYNYCYANGISTGMGISTGIHSLSRSAAAVFIYYFNCISFAIRLSGRKVAIKLVD